MKTYPINLHTIRVQLSERHIHASEKVKSNIELILNELNKLVKVAASKALPRWGQKEENGIIELSNIEVGPIHLRTFDVAPTALEYVNLLSLQLILAETSSLVRILTYHALKFESNPINPQLSFVELLKKYVIQSVKTNTGLLSIEQHLQEQILESIDFFIEQPVGKHSSKVYFYFNNKNEKEQIIDALKPFVEDESKYLLTDFLSHKLPVQRVKFNISAKRVTEFFLRLIKQKIVGSTTLGLCKWLADRCYFKNAISGEYIILKPEGIRKPIRKQNCSVKPQERIFPELGAN